MRTVLMALIALMPTSAFAETCTYSSSQGDKLAWVKMSDYDFEYQAADGSKTLCLLLRSPEKTTGACDNGVDDEFYYAASAKDGPDDLLVFDHRVWYRGCTD